MAGGAAPVATTAGPTVGRPGRALAWSVANTAAGRLGTLAIGIVLARLLGPAEFGTYAVALVALMAILSFNELGVSLAIVRWEADPADIAPTVTTISVAMSSVLTGVAVLTAPAFARAMGDPDATQAVRLLAVCVLINGIVATPAALLQRRFRQDQRMVADQVNVWLGAVISVSLALVGMGAMSLVIGRLAGAGVSALLLVHYSPLPLRCGYDRQHARLLLAFGLPLAGASVIVFLVGFLDQLMIGALLGSTLLGFYVLAGNLALWPVSMFSQPLRSVAPAMFARRQHDPDLMRTTFRQLLRPLCAVALPVCALLSALAPEIVAFVYGDAWAGAGPVLRWLGALAALRILFELAYDYLVVLGRAGAILAIQVWTVLVLAPAMYAGVEAGGIEGGAVAAVVVGLVVTLPLYLRQLARAGLRPAALAGPVLVPAAGAAATAGLGLAASALLTGLAALILAALGCAVLIALLLVAVRADLSAFRGAGA